MARFYHISESDLGEHPTFYPRIPLSAAKCEPEVLRICVAPTVPQCYLALECHELINRRDIPETYVYEVETDDFIDASPEVYDSEITDEKWLLSPHTLHFVLKMPKIPRDFIANTDMFCEYVHAAYECHYNQQKRWLENERIKSSP